MSETKHAAPEGAGHSATDRSWDATRRATFTHEQDVEFLRRAIEVSRRSREHGNTPFGAILVNEHHEVVLEQENIEVSTHKCTGHAETSLMERASVEFDRDYLWQCTLYTTGEPCAMCSGAIYWGNVGRVVYAMTERQILEQTGSSEQNPTLDTPCREIFGSSQKDIEVVGPFPELVEEAAAVHKGYWD